MIKLEVIFPNGVSSRLLVELIELAQKNNCISNVSNYEPPLETKPEDTVEYQMPVSLDECKKVVRGKFSIFYPPYVDNVVSETYNYVCQKIKDKGKK